MANTLDIDDEWGPVDIVIAVETAFAIKLSDAEVRDVHTVGAMYDLLCRRIAVGHGRKCASAMAFYRLRRAVADLAAEDRLRPQSDLSFLERGRAKRRWKQLERTLNLRLPALDMAHPWMATVPLCAALAAVPVAAVGVALAFSGMAFGEVLLQSSLWLLVGGLALAMVGAGLDPGKLPDGLRSLGALAQAMADKNYGQFVAGGAVLTEAVIWRVMLAAFADHTALPLDQVTRDTTFLKSAQAKAA